MESKKLYGLRCRECKEDMDEVYCTYDELIKIMEEQKCPECGGELFQPPAFGAGRFRGSGFTKRGC